ncbi:MAG: exoribonuclease [Steroidobacteraceae bacterium]|jgi:hypothetical protein|nr:exoribonuclease [Steroidobacteraceae bacterium]
MKFVSLCVAVIFLAACGSRSSDEEQVRALLDAAEAAAEARDTSDVLEVIASDYSDSQGFDRAQLQGFLRAYFLANPRVEILLTVQDLEFPVEGLGRARVGITSLPAGDRATVQVEFRKEGTRWLVSRADRVRN